MAVAQDGTINDVPAFVMEKHLERFLVLNWRETELGKEYDILEENGKMIGLQYLRGTRPIDILQETSFLSIQIRMMLMSPGLSQTPETRYFFCDLWPSVLFGSPVSFLRLGPETVPNPLLELPL